MHSCENCLKRTICQKDIGIIFGGCNKDYVLDKKTLYAMINDPERDEDNLAYKAQIHKELQRIFDGLD